jgi:hypothetical protein
MSEPWSRIARLANDCWSGRLIADGRGLSNSAPSPVGGAVTFDKPPSTVGLHQQSGALKAARAACTERRKEVIPKIRRVPAAMQAEGDGAFS